MSEKFTIIIAEDDEVIRNLYEMILPAEYNCKLHVFQDGRDALQFIKDGGRADLVISDYDMPNHTGGDLYLKAVKDLKIPFFLITGRFLLDISDIPKFLEDHPQNRYLQKPIDPKMFHYLVNDLYQQFITKNRQNPYAAQGPQSQDKINLTMMPITLLKKYGFDSTDVYIQLHQDRLTKIISKENSFSLDKRTLEEYEARGLKDVLIPKSVFDTLTQHMINQLTVKARQLKKVTPLDIAGLQVNVSLKGLNDLGVTEDQINSVNEILEETIQSIFTDKTIELKIKELMKGYNYHISHSVLLMYVASSILRKTNLPYQSTLKKIALAAFFHDISIDNDVAELEFSPQDIKQEPISKEHKRLLEHPLTSINFLQKSDDDLFSEVKKIIGEHHELPNGKGYPRGLTASQISPLSALFITAHQIANCLYRNDYKKDSLVQFMANIESDFMQGQFKTYFEAAKKAFL